MLFGDKARFAVELLPLPDDGVSYPECLFAYWIDGQTIGNPALPTYVHLVQSELTHHLQDRGLRRNDRLASLTPEAFVQQLTAWRSGDSELEDLALEERWSSHDLSGPLDYAAYEAGHREDWKVFVVEGPEAGRIVAFEAGRPSDLIRAVLPPGHADRVLMEAWQALSDR